MEELYIKLSSYASDPNHYPNPYIMKEETFLTQSNNERQPYQDPNDFHDRYQSNTFQTFQNNFGSQEIDPFPANNGLYGGNSSDIKEQQQQQGQDAWNDKDKDLEEGGLQFKEILNYSNYSNSYYRYQYQSSVDIFNTQPPSKTIIDQEERNHDLNSQKVTQSCLFR